jgi:transposase
MATTNGTALPTAQTASVLNSGLGESEGGRAAQRPNPEVVARAKRRRFKAAYKREVLAQADAAKGSGEIGAVLRRHGLYSSHLTHWRQERDAGILEGLTPHKRGPKVKTDSRALEYQKLQRENERLTEQLRKAEIVIDVQKKVATLLGQVFPQTETRS